MENEQKGSVIVGESVFLRPTTDEAIGQQDRKTVFRMEGSRIYAGSKTGDRAARARAFFDPHFYYDESVVPLLDEELRFLLEPEVGRLKSTMNFGQIADYILQLAKETYEKFQGRLADNHDWKGKKFSEAWAESRFKPIVDRFLETPEMEYPMDGQRTPTDAFGRTTTEPLIPGTAPAQTFSFPPSSQAPSPSPSPVMKHLTYQSIDGASYSVELPRQNTLLKVLLHAAIEKAKGGSAVEVTKSYEATSIEQKVLEVISRAIDGEEKFLSPLSPAKVNDSRGEMVCDIGLLLDPERAEREAASEFGIDLEGPDSE